MTDEQEYWELLGMNYQPEKTMNKSESIAALAAALSKAQGEMKGAKKDSANPFFKSKYADLASVVEAIREPLTKNGLSYIQLTEPSEKEEVRVETVLMHGSGEWVSGITAVPVTKADAQGYGSAMTYARRYGLQSICGIPAEDDDGNAAASAAITPNAGAGDEMTAKEKSVVLDHAAVIKDFIKTGNDWGAYEYIEERDFNTEQKLFLWAQLSSSERSAIKRVGAADRTRQAKETKTPVPA